MEAQLLSGLQMGVYASPGGAFVYILAPLQKTYYIRNLCPFTFKLSELYIDNKICIELISY